MNCAARANRVAGKVVKTLVLRKAGNTNLEIIAVKGRRGWRFGLLPLSSSCCCLIVKSRA